jgi:hypothetical protein
MTNAFSHIILNRKPMIHDHRDYRMVDYITPSMRKRASQITETNWQVDHILDQGNTGHCVGFAWAGFGIALPVFDNWDNSMGDKIYYQAKIIDGEPNQEDGSDTRSGVQAFMNFSQLQNNAYAFASSIDDVITWVLSSGPVVGGTNWYNNMFNPDSNGLVSLGGGIAGGHEWEIIGFSRKTNLFNCVNSWGTSFGVNGHFYITTDDYQRLLEEQGDACTATEVSNTPIPPSPDPQPLPSGNDGYIPIDPPEPSPDDPMHHQ